MTPCLPSRLSVQRVVCQRFGVEVQGLGVLQQLDAVPLCSAPRPGIFSLCSNNRKCSVTRKPPKHLQRAAPTTCWLTSAVAGAHGVRVARLLHLVAAPVPRSVVFSWVPVALLPLLQQTTQHKQIRTLQRGFHSCCFPEDVSSCLYVTGCVTALTRVISSFLSLTHSSNSQKNKHFSVFTEISPYSIV